MTRRLGLKDREDERKRRRWGNADQARRTSRGIEPGKRYIEGQSRPARRGKGQPRVGRSTQRGAVGAT
eukprot:CAMPEP_0172527398 /NCGR_PEP_ID=MMETSP1067-20121228/2100_1 /TAXON_ID=265564 ORGANISM="Thalassiosira punctigera, Strain Tpunct2005C2" /NCGR_SAMPLE_ID=MMETSP1067 /ASSEMBLY_ACC=CAM_ASM_000444 /LENGTH=67 /DNA_ID=CAMNT_0013311133 /DNA_START=501 /DNA_END=704 /DNA_ORIENTATION=+